ncbi:MAG: hypothetical protein AAGA96_12555 [Verrucomicrobiota bacterium]
MSNFRVLIAAEVVDTLSKLRKQEREALRLRFEAIAETPARFSDYQEKDDVGRDVDVHLFGKHAILFWHDFNDRHLKILDLMPADGLIS